MRYLLIAGMLLLPSVAWGLANIETMAFQDSISPSVSYGLNEDATLDSLADGSNTNLNYGGQITFTIGTRGPGSAEWYRVWFKFDPTGWIPRYSGTSYDWAAVDSVILVLTVSHVPAGSSPGEAADSLLVWACNKAVMEGTGAGAAGDTLGASWDNWRGNPAGQADSTWQGKGARLADSTQTSTYAFNPWSRKGVLGSLAADTTKDIGRYPISATAFDGALLSAGSEIHIDISYYAIPVIQGWAPYNRGVILGDQHNGIWGDPFAATVDQGHIGFRSSDYVDFPSQRPKVIVYYRRVQAIGILSIARGIRYLVR